MSNISTHTHILDRDSVIQQALTEYRTTAFLNIHQTAQKYGIQVGELRVAFAKYLEDRYCKKK
ncbi:hypothetical protein [Sulfuricurvum sp.]|uniref:hypothetical protein n=1 Tax=Sulfuricurvum sp. TaxID=2025608 RepID=UPI002D4DD20F|nr:hypothetical protein [Sulfuricurvum sp.]HZF69382.1 hypothetical protein [Sulfuricurvum sp.]